MSAEITRLEPSSYLTPEQILARASAEDEPWDELMLIGYFKGSENLVVRSSRLTRAQALWLLESAKIYTLTGEREMARE